MALLFWERPEKLLRFLREEQDVIIQVARQEIGKETVLMVGTGKYSTEATVHATRRAKELGADAALVVCPYYNKPTQEGLFLHYETLCNRVDLPIIIYNHPGRTSLNMHTNTLVRLASLPNIVGVKEGSFDIIQMMDVIEKTRKVKSDFTVMSSDDILTLALMCHGGDGVISVVGNVVPTMMRHLVDAAKSGNYAEAKNLHYQLLPLFRDAFIETNPIPIKTLMNLLKMPAGPCRLPLCDLQPENKRKLETLLTSLPYVKHDQTESPSSKTPYGVFVS